MTKALLRGGPLSGQRVPEWFGETCPLVLGGNLLGHYVRIRPMGSGQRQYEWRPLVTATNEDSLGEGQR